MSLGYLIPDWPVPPAVHAVVTTRLGGFSQGPYASLNLATHVGDNPHAVAENRRLLRQALKLPDEPVWLEQVHGTAVWDRSGKGGCFDAAFTDQPGVVLAVLTADCLPVFLASGDGGEIGVAHAGWRGLASGVLEGLLARFSTPASAVHAWLGPAIGPVAFEVGEEVRTAFVTQLPEAAAAFTPGRPGHWHADLFCLARQRLAACGVKSIQGGGVCTFSDPARFYSYRRDGVTGRMASLIWLKS